MTVVRQQRMLREAMPPAIKTVFFDAFGTLIYLPSTVGEHYREIGLRHGLDLPAEALDRAFRSQWKSAPSRPPTTDGPRPDDDKGWWRELVRAVIGATAPDTARKRFDFDAYFEELYAHFAQPGVWAAFPEVAGVLDTLRANGFQLGVISNFDRRLYQILDGLALRHRFAQIVISSEVGADKPDPAIFRHAMEKAAAKPNEVIHVGDDPERDWGAKSLGLEVFELERPRHSLWDLLPVVEERLRSGAS